MHALLTSPRVSRLVRLAAVLGASITSVATFGGSSGWELHDRTSDAAPETLSASIVSWSDTFRVRGNGIGRTDVALDGAIEITPSAALSTPVRVRVRFVPTNPAGDIEESTVFVTSREVFTAVTSRLRCDADPMVACSIEGTLEVEALDAASLGGETLSVHWVVTGSVDGRGPSAPADGGVTLTQP